MPMLIDLRDQVLHKMRLNANNLFTFAKANPLVHLTKTGTTVPVRDAARCDFNIRKIMNDLLK